MDTASARAVRAILMAGLTCGVLDGISAVAASGGQFTRVFQSVAAGILGRDSFKGGAESAAMGLALHFLVALGASAVYYAASRVLPFMIDRALVSGVLYGVVVQVFMNFVVIPLSAIGRRPFVPRSFLIMLAIHMIVVGPSIALTIRRYSR
jgi:hypothetical protein